MANYKVIGGDLKQYGPVSAESLCKWIADGRLNAMSLVQVHGDIEWKQLSTFPEFADALALAGKPTTLSAPPPTVIPTAWLERDLPIGHRWMHQSQLESVQGKFRHFVHCFSDYFRRVLWFHVHWWVW